MWVPLAQRGPTEARSLTTARPPFVPLSCKSPFGGAVGERGSRRGRSGSAACYRAARQELALPSLLTTPLSKGKAPFAPGGAKVSLYLGFASHPHHVMHHA